MPYRTSSICIEQELQVQELEIVGQKSIQLSILRSFLIAQPPLLTNLVIHIKILPDLVDKVVGSVDEAVFKLHVLVDVLRDYTLVLLVKSQHVHMQKCKISPTSEDVGLLLHLQLVFGFFRRLERHLSGSEVHLTISINNEVRFDKEIFKVLQKDLQCLIKRNLHFLFLEIEVDRLGKERESEKVLPLDSLLSVHLQHLGNDVLDFSVQIRLPLQFFLFYVRLQVLEIGPGPGRAAVQHFVENNSHAPHVTLIGELLIRQYLRRGVQGRAEKGHFLCFIGILNHPAETEVTELGHSLFEQDISGFDVPVDDALLEEGKVSLSEMSHEGLRLRLTQSLILAILLEVVLEIAVLAVLKHHVDVLPRPEIVIQLDDKGRLQAGQIFYLILYLLFYALIDLLDIDALHRHLRPRVVLPVEDRASGSRPQRMRFQDAVSAHLLYHLVHRMIISWAKVENLTFLRQNWGRRNKQQSFSGCLQTIIIRLLGMTPVRLFLLAVVTILSTGMHARQRYFNSNWLTSGVHDHTCYTQGFSFINNTHILQSCGLYGQSYFHILQFSLNDQNQTSLTETYCSPVFPKTIFLQGSILFPKNNIIYILTWQEKIAYRINPSDYSQLDPLQWTAGQGWGMTHNNTHIFISTGSNSLFVCDQYLNVLQTLPITNEYGSPLNMINQLEWVQQHGQQYIYANIYTTADIVKISIENRTVVTRFVENKMAVDSKRQPYGKGQDVLNGIAYDQERELFVLTGKQWPKYYLTSLNNGGQ